MQKNNTKNLKKENKGASKYSGKQTGKPSKKYNQFSNRKKKNGPSVGRTVMGYREILPI